MRLKQWIRTGIVLLLLLGIALLGLGFLLPYHRAETDLPDRGQLVLEAQADGSWILDWPQVDSADLYRVELYQGSPEEDNLVYRDFVRDDSQLSLPQIPADLPFALRVTAGAEFQTVFGESVRYGEHSLEAQLCFEAPVLSSFELTINGDDKIAAFTAETEDLWQYTLLDPAGEILEIAPASENTVTLTFGENGAHPLPADGEAYTLRSRAYREQPGLILYSVPTEDYPITGEALQMRKLNPVLTETSKNTIDIAWSETRGDHYEVQQLLGGSWETCKQVAQGDPRHFFTWVAPGETETYRVVAVDEQGAYPVVSQELEFTGRELAKNVTIWPTRNLAGLSHPHSGEILDYAREGQAYWVLEEVDGAFAVRIHDQICYIDSNYCLVNLPEYMGGLCNYNITNGVSSIYAVHDFPIPNVTGVVTPGYENVHQADGTSLAPLLYPTAKKLVRAAQSAMEHGYRLKIYDSFRPYVATREVYDLTAQVLGEPLADETYLGIPKSTLELPPPRDGQEELTLGWLMTGRNYDLRSFLARDGSAHNLGIAMDLTLESLKTGEEIPMQSRIHDLSHYSVLSENNEAADLLSSIMQKAGFNPLVSEWWHFQDNDSKSRLGLNPVVNGIDAACWVRDDNGWKYRSPKGAFYAGQTLEISGTSYTFNDDGYVAE